MQAFDHLEFSKLLSYIKTKCHSFCGENYLNTFKPLDNRHLIENRLNLINDIQHIIFNVSDYNFENVYEIDILLEEVKTLAFNFDEFKAIIFTLKISNQILHDKDEWIEYKVFSMFVKELSLYDFLEKRFFNIFDLEGNVLDTASAELKNIRSKSRRLRDKIQSELSKTINDSQVNSYLQDKIVTKRDERFVIPVKEGFAYMVEGISHGRSGSGASIFIEPKAVVPLNNELNDLASAEKEEIYRVFCEFTAMIRDEVENIIINFKILCKLDAYFACARLSNELQAIVPEIVDENIINLKRARHPLLIIKYNSVTKVIPFDICLGKDFKILLISGPNTGGKTITLKTIGLCTLMALTGLPIPVDYGTQIGLLSNVFADIGDNQSIESSLSTYSGHIQNIKEIVMEGNQQSLVLIDEIGSATDPEQGSALAQAILEKLVEIEVLAVITTHYTSLKVFAENNPICVNASMQFDPEKHEPTYQFVLGFPGNSFALEIASRLGLDNRLIQRAQDLTGSQNIILTDLIKKINEEKKKLAENNYQMELKSRVFEMRSKEYENKINELEQDKKRLLKSSLKDTQEYLTGIQKKLNEELSDLKKQSKEEKKDKIKQLNKEVIDFQDSINSQKAKLSPRNASNQHVELGDNVWIRSFEAKAVIVDIQKDIYRVDMNGIFFNVKKDDLYKLEKDIVDEPVSLVSRKNTTFNGKAKMEINLLGKTFDEALPIIQDFIDDALFSGLSKIRIVHGKGTGILRKKIREYLKKNSKVQDFYSPAQEAGGDGVTVVSL